MEEADERFPARSIPDLKQPPTPHPCLHDSFTPPFKSVAG
jgi:hypothetical protein